MPPALAHISKYRIERELGRGAMGVVYKAFDPVVERMVAIKTIRLDVEDPEELVNRLRREAKSVGQLEHPNIVTLYDAGESSGLFYLAMQFIQGETLQERLTRQRWFTLREVQDLFRQICAGLDYAHQRGVIHRDIKPANIMMTAEGKVKLTDFGIAKMAAGGTTTTGLIVGTPSYMSPEQALGKPVDSRSDIFSLGSILYELITGEKAFPGQNTTTVMYKIVHESPTPPRAVQPGVDPAVEAIVLKALAKNPDERFQACNELSTALDLYIEMAEAAMKKTSVVVGLPAAMPAAQTPSSSTTPPSSAQPPVAAGPSSSWSVLPADRSAPAPSTLTQPSPAMAGRPLAWVGGGILGTLFLVIVILLVIRMQHQGTMLAPASPPAGGSAQAPATSRGSASEPAIGGHGKPLASQSVPSESQRPAARPSSVTISRSAPPSRQAAIPREPGVRAVEEFNPGRSGATQSSLRTTRTQVPSKTAPSPVDRESFDSLIVKGDLAFQESRYAEALNAYSAAYRLNPNNREVRRKIAVVLTLLGRPSEAQKYQ